MAPQDITLIAITAWRENRSGGYQGMQSVVNVIMNRAAKHGASPYAICTAHAQFSSITMAGPEAYLWPSESDPEWLTALILATQASNGLLGDITGGAVNYYALSIPPPYWVESMTHTVNIEGQAFFK